MQYAYLLKKYTVILYTSVFEEIAADANLCHLKDSKRKVSFHK